jgi:N-methylhydantoinase B
MRRSSSRKSSIRSWSGGLGVELTYRALGKTLTNVNCDRTKDPPWGLNGGKPGAVNEALLVRSDSTEQKLLKATGVPMQPGDRLVFRTAGGGGWGDPRLRGRREIADDVAKGYVSAEAARRDYGFDAARESIHDSAAE